MKVMTKSNILKNIFSHFNKSKFQEENQLAAKESLESICKSLNILNQKAINIKENYSKQQIEIQNCFESIQKIEPSASVRAGKFEQQIAVAITKVSTELDKIFTTKNCEPLDQSISQLTRSIRERENADNIQEE